MSLLDNIIQEVQDICGHTALRARKCSGFICKRASKDTVLCLLKEEEEERMPNRDFILHGCICKMRYIATLYTLSIGNQPYNTMLVFKNA